MLTDASYGFAIGLIMTGSGKGLNKLQDKVNNGQKINRYRNSRRCKIN